MFFVGIRHVFAHAARIAREFFAVSLEAAFCDHVGSLRWPPLSNRSDPDEEFFEMFHAFDGSTERL
jgi:hypothetical protein